MKLFVTKIMSIKYVRKVILVKYLTDTCKLILSYENIRNYCICIGTSYLNDKHLLKF